MFLYFCINICLLAKYNLEKSWIEIYFTRCIEMDRIWKATGNFECNGSERGESLWVQEKYRYGEDMTSSQQIRKEIKPRLQGDNKIDVVVIGAGMAGILTAYMLKEQGISVVVLECKKIGEGMTKNTTAKVTSQHGLIYNKLIKYKGEERAREYALANQYAIQKYEEIIQKRNIDCDYEVLPNYIYTLDNETSIKQEVDAARKLGIPAVFTKETTLAFKVMAAVRFDRQAQFHPLKFLDAIAKDLTVYEDTIVKEIRKDGLIITDNGSVKANSIVIATHYPFINAPGFYFLKLHQERYYVAALEGISGGKLPRLDGMYLDADPQGFSFRNYQDYLLLGGGSHRSGEYNPVNAYAKIEEAAKKWYPNATIKYTWSNQDCMTPDSVPYIGRYSTSLPNLYVATGFNTWGMTSSMVSAMILSDMIRGKENAFQKVFCPRRLMFSGSAKVLKDVAVSTISLLSELLKIPRNKLEEIPAGHAGVIREDGKKIGVYRDQYGNYYYVSTKCPHLGCSLEWNQNELTWDCPCHGSRFDYHGNLINNPAMRDTFDACQRKK